jgi:hypothetical protein
LAGRRAIAARLCPQFEDATLATKGEPMSNDANHYRELAARAQAEADAASLDNVRDRALRSAAAFETMAQQHELTAKRRAAREAAVGQHDAAQADVSEHDKETT